MTAARAGRRDRPGAGTRTTALTASAAATAVHLWLGLAVWNTGRSGSYDLGLFAQAAQHWARGELPRSEIRAPGGFLLLGEHFSPATAVFGAAWWVWPDPRALVVAQALALGAGVGLFAALARRHLPAGWAWALTALLALSHGLVAAAKFDVHEVALAVPLLVAALGAVLERRTRAAVAWSLPLLLVKEDLGLTVAAVAVVLLLRARGRRERWWALGLGLAGAAGFAGALAVVSALNPDGTNPFSPAFAAVLGLLEPGAAGAGATGPDPVGTRARLALLAVVLLGGGVLWVASPLALVALPTLAWRLASGNPSHTQTQFHYDAVLMPVVAVALLDVARRLLRPSAGRARRRTPGGARRAVLAAAVACGLVLSAVHYPRTSIAPSPLDADSWRPGRDARDLRALADALPAGALVAADNGAGAYLVGRGPTVRMLRNSSAVPAGWVVLNTTVEGTTASRAAKEDFLAAMERREEERGDVRVLRRGAMAAVELPCTGWVWLPERRPPPWPLPAPVWEAGCG